MVTQGFCAGELEKRIPSIPEGYGWRTHWLWLCVNVRYLARSRLSFGRCPPSWGVLIVWNPQMLDKSEPSAVLGRLTTGYFLSMHTEGTFRFMAGGLSTELSGEPVGVIIRRAFLGPGVVTVLRYIQGFRMRVLSHQYCMTTSSSKKSAISRSSIGVSWVRTQKHGSDAWACRLVS